MPKVRQSRQELVTKWIKSVGDSTLVSDESDETAVYCTVCDKHVLCEKKWLLTQHIRSNRHRRNVQIASNSNASTSSENAASITKRNEFFKDLTQAMAAVNMPWRTLDNETWRNFLSKYTGQNIPNESTLRKNYLNECYELAIVNIKKDIGDNYVWISVDETTNKMGQYIANLIVGKLSDSEVTRPHLFCCQQLEQTNHETIARFINSSVHNLLPPNSEERILLLVTDAAPYMVKAGKKLKLFYPNMIHITCVVHGLHRIAEDVRLHFPLVNELISSVKKVFLKAPLRIEVYRKKLTNTPLPPEPVLTRWGTWLKAAIFYAEHFDKIKEVIESFEDIDNLAIRTAQHIVQQTQVPQNAAFIKTHMQIIPVAIKKLETIGLPLTSSTQIFMDCIEQLRNIPGSCGEQVRRKVDAIMKKNTGFGELSKVAKILSGEIVPTGVKHCHLGKYKYAPITSCDVERSFSAYKSILSDKRQQLTVANVEKLLVIYCNANYGS